MAVINGTCSSNSSSYDFYISYSFTQNISANTSTVTASAVIKITGTKTFSSAGAKKTCKISIAGTEKTESKALSCLGSKGTEYVIITNTVTVPHNSDGTKSIALSATVATTNNTYGPGYCSASGTATLTTIPRASSVSLSKTSVAADEHFSVTITPKTSNRKHNIRLSVANSPDSNNDIKSAISAATTYDKVFDQSWIRYVPNSMSADAKVKVQTMDANGNYIGSQVEKNIIYKVPDYTLTGTLAVTSSDTTLIQNRSTVNIKVTPIFPNSYYETEIVNIKVRAFGTTYNSLQLNNIVCSQSGEQEITVEFSDTRGKTASLTQTVTVVPYKTPYIRSTTISRGTSDPTEVTVKISAYMSTLDNTASGTLYCEIEKYSIEPAIAGKAIVGKATCGSGILVQAIEVGGESGDYVSEKFTFSGIDSNNTFNGKAYIIDSFGVKSAEYDFIIPTEEVVMDVHSSGSGIAFGKVSQTEGIFEVEYPLKFNSTITYLDSEIKDFVVEYGTKSSWNYRKWNSGTVELWRNDLSKYVSLNTIGSVFYDDFNITNIPLVEEIYFVSVDLLNNIGKTWTSSTISSDDAKTVNVTVFGAATVESGSSLFKALIIGRWK